MIKSKLFKNLSIYTFSDLINKMVPFLLLPVLTRYLTPSDYGNIAIFFVLTSLLGVIISVEAKTSISVFFFKKSRDNLKVYIANILFIVSSFTTIILLFILFFDSFLEEILSLSKEWIIVAVIVTFAQFLTTVNMVLWQSEHNSIFVGVYKISQTIINLSLSLVLIIGLKMGWEGRLIAITFASIIFGGYSIALLFKRDYIEMKFDKESIKEALSFGLPLLPHALSVWFRTGIDRIFLTTYISAAATGMYTVAFQIASILYVVAVALNKAFSPYLYKKLNDITNEEKIKLIRYSYGYFLLLLIGAFILSGISPFIVNYFLGSKFVEAQQYITFLSFSFAFQGMYLMVVNYVLYMKKTALLSYVTITISIIHILLSYILITQYGLMGAAQATLITSILTFFSVWILSYKVYKMPWLSVFARDHRSE